MSQKYRFNANIKQHLRALTRLDNHHGLLAVLEDYLVLSCAIAAFFLSPGIPFWRLDEANAIRREDIHYDKLNTEMGGLITRSKTSAPSAISTIIQSLSKAPNSFSSPNANNAQVRS